MKKAFGDLPKEQIGSRNLQSLPAWTCRPAHPIQPAEAASPGDWTSRLRQERVSLSQYWGAGTIVQEHHASWQGWLPVRVSGGAVSSSSALQTCRSWRRNCGLWPGAPTRTCPCTGRVDVSCFCLASSEMWLKGEERASPHQQQPAAQLH